MDAQDRIDYLKEKIRICDYDYYVNHQSSITDLEYDNLFAELKKLESENPDLISSDSPTQRISNSLNKSFQTVDHTVPMISLDNSYNENDLIDFDRKVQEFTSGENIQYCIEPKFDGASIALVYENDLLVRAATRGNGTQGDDITNNARTIQNIPLRADFSSLKIKKIEIRGEIVITKQNFHSLNEKAEELGNKIAANPRNFASGSLRMQDPKEVAKRNLTAILYSVAYAVDENGQDVIVSHLNDHHNSIEILSKLGFTTPIQEMRVCNSVEDLNFEIKNWEEKRDNFPIEIDGMVIKVNEYSAQIKCGSTSHHPRWAIAYKFKPKQAHTKLLSIEYQVGRTGAVTPVAKLNPVALAGVVVSSVSLHNEEYIKEKDIRIGDTLVVERAGDVIPYIACSLPEKRDGTEQIINFPTTCPTCQSILVKTNEEAVWRCENYTCEAQSIQRIIHFTSKDAMDIAGLGEAITQRFFELKFLKSINDIYDLPFDEIGQLEKFGTKSTENLKQAIENSKTQSLQRLIYGLGIRYVGETTAKSLAKEVQDIEQYFDKDVEDLLHIEDIGIKVAQSVSSFFKDKINQETILNLKSKGINTSSEKKEVETLSDKLAGKTFLFTGSLSILTRDAAEKKVEAHGGKILSGVSSKLNYLVVGEKAGSKLIKAQKIPDIIILTEDEFVKNFI